MANTKKKEEVKTLQDQFDEQLKQFVTEPITNEYDRYKPIGPKVLVKLFKFTPRNPEEGLGKQQILMPDPLNPGSVKPTIVALNEKVYNIARVIKIGYGNWGTSSVQPEDIEVGKTYIVPYNDIVGIKPNPDFLHAMNTYKGKTGGQGALVKITEEMNIPQNLPKLDIEWARYKFSMPDRLGPETEKDKLVYLISAQKLEAEYEFSK